MKCRKSLVFIAFFLILLLMILLTGCFGSFWNRGPIPDVDPRLLYNRLERHISFLHTFEGYARFTAVTEFGAFQGSLHLKASNPDTLWMKVEGPMGVDLGILQLFGTQVLLYIPLEKTVYKGSLESPVVQRLLPIPLPSGQMVLGMQGLLLPDSVFLDSLTEFSNDGKHYTYGFGKMGSALVAPKGPVVARFVHKNRLDLGELEWRAGQFRKIGKVRLPKMVQITQSEPKQQLTVYYDWVKTNKSLNRGWAELVLPEDVHVVELD